MGKQIVVDLIFNANTQQAKQQMNSLQNQLNQLQNTTIKSIATEGLTNDLSKASNAVISLKTNLSNAFNVDTGKLDLGKFSTNLKNSNMTLRDYRIALEQLGPAGQNAFNQLTQSIINGQIPLKQTKNLITSMMNTFGSSIKWTIAYGAIDGIRQGFQDAFQYAQDLNESLTNIGVVAGKSADEMSKFAEKANKAAKALSATTVAYSDAALIYYQQGLNDEQVAERAATTMKLANVVGESASTVSEWMTAIWNNFDDGSKKLEYYADVMAKLGAETASSADEIADGFEKFAAVADTVGLSYERGAAAIATVTATTRQSADVVGTAFKTIFARIQDLELGNTLDDGTTLGQYSEALNKVGINIKTTSGDLREMDDILVDMGATWKTLSNDEQVALAKSVAGIRQYTQLIALMNNFDYFEQLTNSAENAEGTLEEQQERWAESWEASTNRVKAASEGIYSNLINDEFFINLNNIWADLLSGLDELMDSMGGLKTILPIVLGFLLKTFGPTAISMVSSFATSLKGVSTEAQNTAMNMRKTALEESSKMALNEGGQASSIAADAYKKELDFIIEIEKIQRNLNSKEVEELKILGEQVKARREYLVLLGKAADEAAKNVDTQEKELAMSKIDLQKDSTNAYSSHHNLSTLVNNANIPLDAQINLKQQINQSADNIAKAGETQGRVNEYIDKEYKVNKNGKVNKAGITDIQKNLASDDAIMSQLDTGTQDLIRNFDGDINVLEKIKQALKELNLEAKAAREAEEALSKSFQDAGIENAEEAIKDFTNSQEKLAETSNKIASGERNLAKLRDESKEALKTNEEAINEQNKEMDGAIDKAKQMQKVPLGNTLTAAAGAASMLAGGLSSVTSGLNSAIQSIKDGTFGFDDFLSALISITTGLTMVVGGWNSLSKTIKETTLFQTASLLKSKEELGVLGIKLFLKRGETDEEKKQALFKALGLKDDKDSVLMESISKILEKNITDEEKWQLIYKELQNAAQEESINNTTAEIALEKAQTAGRQKALTQLKNGFSKIGDKFKTMGKDIGKLFSSGAIGYFAAAAAIFAVMAIGVSHIVKAHDAHNKKAEESAKYAEKIGESYNNVKQEFEDLKSSLEDYNKAKLAIDELTTGTQAWRDAVQEVNEQVLTLIDKYPHLASEVENVNGQLILSEKAQAEVLQSESNRTAALYNASQNAKLQARRDQNEADRINLSRSGLDTNSGAEIAGGGLGGAAGAGAGAAGGALAAMGIGAAIGASSTGPFAAVGAIVGAVIGLGVGIYAGVTQADRVERQTENTQAIEELQKLYEEQGDSLFIKENWESAIDNLEVSESLAEALKENAKETQNLIKSNQELIDLENATLDQKVNSYLNTNQFNDWDAYGDNVAKLTREKYRTVQNNTNEYQGQSLDIDDWVKYGFLQWTASDTGEDAAQKYLDARYGEGKARVSDFHDKDSGMSIEVKSDDGKWEEQDDTISYEAVQDYLKELAITEENKELLEYTYNLTNAIGDLEYQAKFAKATDTYGQAAGALAEVIKNDNLDLATKEEIDALDKLLEDGELTRQEFQKMNIDATNLADALNLSGNPVEALTEKIRDLRDSWTEEKHAVAQALATQQEIDSLFTASAETLETTSNAFETYMEHLIDTNKALEDDKKLAAQLSVAHYKLAKGIVKLKETLQENIEVLQLQDKHSLDYYESLGKVKTALEETFDTKLSTNFVEENLERIQNMANGSEQALKELRQEMVKDFLFNLELTTDGKNVVNEFLSDIDNQLKNADLSETITIDSNMVDVMNELLANGQVTQQELQGMFNNLGIEMPDLKFHTAWGPEVRSKSYTTDSKGKKTGDEVITVTQSEVAIPYFEGGNKPTIDTSNSSLTGEKSITISSGTGKGIKTQATNNLHSYDDILNYKGDAAEVESASDRKKRLKDLDNEIERYHEIDETIENTERELDKLSKAKDRAFGQSKLNLMDQEIAKNRELLQQQKDRLQEAQNYYNLDRKNLLSNYAVELDDEGNITNYNELIQEQINKLKGMDKDSVAYEETSAYLSQMKEDFAQYEETLDTLYDAQQGVIDKQNELADQALEKIQYEVEFKVEMSERDNKYLDFLLSAYEDKPFEVVQKIKYQSDKANNVHEQYKATQKGIQDILNKEANGEELTDNDLQTLLKYEEELYNYEKQLREIKATVEGSLTEAYNAYNEELDKNASKLEYNASIIDHYKNVVDLLGQDYLGIGDETITNMWETQLKNADAAAKVAKTTLEANEAHLERLKKAKADAPEDDQDYWDKQIKQAEEKVREASENFNSAWETALQTAADKFAASMETVAKNFEKSVSGIYGTIDKLQEAFDRQKETSERYLADYEKTYEISKLNRQIEQSIDKTDSISNQKALRGLQSELLEMSKDEAQVSEYQIGMMQKKYDLMLAEQALRDAQNAKSVVRLSRNSEGSFGYVYAADQEAIDNAQQNYEDKLYELQKYFEDSLNTLQEGYLSTLSAFSEAEVNLLEAVKSGNEAAIAEAQRVYDYYQGQLKFYTEQSNYFINQGVQLNRQYNTSMAESFEDTYLGSIMPNITSFNEFYSLATQAMSKATEDTKNNIQTYAININTSFENVGKKSGELEQYINEDMLNISEDIQSVIDKAGTLSREMSSNLGAATGAVTSFQSSFALSMGGVRGEITETIASIDSLLGKYEKLKEKKDDPIVPKGEAGDRQTNKTQDDKTKKRTTSPNYAFEIDDKVHASNKNSYSINNNTAKSNNVPVTFSGYSISNRKSIKGINYYSVALPGGAQWFAEEDLMGYLPKVLYDEEHPRVCIPGGGVIYYYPTSEEGIYYKLTRKLGDQRDADENINKKNKNKNNYYYFQATGNHNKSGFKVEDHNGLPNWSRGPVTENNVNGNRKIFITEDKHDSIFLESAKENGNWYKMTKKGNSWISGTGSYRFSSAFDTGGYTGKWGPEGRMAMLHEKEIVLNSQDTENFLSAIKIVRSMADQLETNALIAKYGLSAYTALNVKPQADTLQQNVTIHAEFPNATNHSEIEEALRNLNNSASQYVFRR